MQTMTPGWKLTLTDWKTWLDRSNVLILDTETTGLGDDAEIVEIALLDTTGKPRYQALSLPVGDVPDEVVRIHGLSRQRLEKACARPWPAIHEEICPILDRAAFILAWNAPFDRRMLEQSARRHGLALPMLLWGDLLDGYRDIHDPSLTVGGSLDAAMADTGATATDSVSHRALPDCHRALAVMRAVTGRR